MNESKVKYLDWYKWVYESELKRKDEMDKLLTFPVTILSIYAGTSYFIIRQYIDRWDHVMSWHDWVFFGLASIFTALFLITAYYLWIIRLN